MPLTGKQRRSLRALGHGLNPVVQLGKGGLSQPLVDAVDRALADHELIKVKLLDTFDIDRHEAAEQLAAQTKSEVAQVLGKTILLYRPDPEDPRIEI
jgi:RNA-binding protein